MKTPDNDYILEINGFILGLNSKREYISILKQLREARSVEHRCSVSLDFGRCFVIRSVFELHPQARDKAIIEIGFRKWVRW